MSKLVSTSVQWNTGCQSRFDNSQLKAYILLKLKDLNMSSSSSGDDLLSLGKEKAIKTGRWSAIQSTTISDWNGILKLLVQIWSIKVALDFVILVGLFIT